MEQVMQAWIWPPGARPVAVDSGLINETVGIEIKGRLYMLLQRLNTGIFDAVLHEDIEAVTSHLERKGLQTPRLVPTVDGTLWHDLNGACWRLMTPVGSRTLHHLQNIEQAESAGACVARFHAATDDLDHVFRFTRPGAHDTDAHFADLRLALMTHRGHRLYGKVSRLADTLMDAWDRWQGPTGLPERVLHGDLKISNLRFDGDTAVALIDLDTLARGTIDIELGDAMRSWCNPAGEDQAEATFRLDLFEGAMRGYLGAGSLTAEECAAIGPGIERICIELAARFGRDALEENYFGFDASIGRGEHNLLRARGQAALAESVIAQRGQIDAVMD